MLSTHYQELSNELLEISTIFNGGIKGPISYSNAQTLVSFFYKYEDISFSMVLEDGKDISLSEIKENLGSLLSIVTQINDSLKTSDYKFDIDWNNPDIFINRINAGLTILSRYCNILRTIEEKIKNEKFVIKEKVTSHNSTHFIDVDFNDTNLLISHLNELRCFVFTSYKFLQNGFKTIPSKEDLQNMLKICTGLNGALNLWYNQLTLLFGSKNTTDSSHTPNFSIEFSDKRGSFYKTFQNINERITFLKNGIIGNCIQDGKINYDKIIDRFIEYEIISTFNWQNIVILFSIWQNIISDLLTDINNYQINTPQENNNINKPLSFGTGNRNRNNEEEKRKLIQNKSGIDYIDIGLCSEIYRVVNGNVFSDVSGTYFVNFMNLNKVKGRLEIRDRQKRKALYMIKATAETLNSAKGNEWTTGIVNNLYLDIQYYNSHYRDFDMDSTSKENKEFKKFIDEAIELWRMSVELKNRYSSNFKTKIKN